MKIKRYDEKPLKSGGEEKRECFENTVFSRAVSFREYSLWQGRCDADGDLPAHLSG